MDFGYEKYYDSPRWGYKEFTYLKTNNKTGDTNKISVWCRCYSVFKDMVYRWNINNSNFTCVIVHDRYNIRIYKPYFNIGDKVKYSVEKVIDNIIMEGCTEGFVKGIYGDVHINTDGVVTNFTYSYDIYKSMECTISDHYKHEYDMSIVNHRTITSNKFSIGDKVVVNKSGVFDGIKMEGCLYGYVAGIKFEKNKYIYKVVREFGPNNNGIEFSEDQLEMICANHMYLELSDMRNAKR